MNKRERWETGLWFNSWARTWGFPLVHNYWIPLFQSRKHQEKMKLMTHDWGPTQNLPHGSLQCISSPLEEEPRKYKISYEDADQRNDHCWGGWFSNTLGTPQCSDSPCTANNGNDAPKYNWLDTGADKIPWLQSPSCWLQNNVGAHIVHWICKQHTGSHGNWEAHDCQNGQWDTGCNHPWCHQIIHWICS